MFHLILVVVSIALVSALVLVTVNYLPGWTRAAEVAESQLAQALPQLESAYDVVVRNADGAIPAVLAESDGGLQTHFLPAMQFSPLTPPGHTWVYGVHAVDASRYSGMAYFCLKPGDGVEMSQALWVAAKRVSGRYPPDQLFLGESCGESANRAQPTSFPAQDVALTLFVAYTPGVNR